MNFTSVGAGDEVGRIDSMHFWELFDMRSRTG
jgi:hypothetical protein